jgi:predicted nucleic acid-binding protein
LTRFLLDTNTVSELRKGRRADPAVLAWRRNVRTSQSWLSVITLMELTFGIALKARKDEPAGRALRDWYEHKLKPGFAGRILSLDEIIAERAATLQAERTRPWNDALIAATALAHDLVLVTRNVRDFAGIADLPLVDPWAAGR